MKQRSHGKTMGKGPAVDALEAIRDLNAHQHQELMRLAVAELQGQYGWTERVAASVMLTVTTAVSLKPKEHKP